MKLGGLMNAASLGVGVAKAEAKAAVERVVKHVVFAAIVLVLLVLAFGFGLGSFSVWLSHQIGTVQALGFMALGFVVLALMVYVIWRVATRPRQQPRPAPSPIAAALNAKAPPDGEGPPPPGSAIGSLAVVSLVGFLLAKQLFRR